MDVAQEWERELSRVLEGGVTERTVGADPENRRATLGQLRGDLAQAAQLRRSDAAPVVAVEDEHDVAAAQVRKVHLGAAGRRQREVGSGLAEA
jgi:hypothetical protein